MEVITKIGVLRKRLAREEDVAFVPTMGNLHAGHIDLVRVARASAGLSGCVVVSIFVNRLQFAPNEDFDKYPRTFAKDRERCAAAGVDVVFAPDESELYPIRQTYVVEPGDIQHVLDGQVRPGHFRGVATVVMKLFNIVQPRFAVFGKKDYQQCRVLSNMVEQFNLPIELVLADTVRADDGLALSSRNSYLTAEQRAEVPRLYTLLVEVRDAMQQPGADAALLETTTMRTLAAHGWTPDYVAIRRRSDLGAPTAADRSLVVLAAARLGKARLIDNLEITLPELAEKVLKHQH